MYRNLLVSLIAHERIRTTEAKAKEIQAMIDKARAKYPEVKIVIAGMQMPPNLGGQYAEQFREVFFQVAKENNATMIPFLLEGVGGLREFNQPDLIHPTAAGHRMIAEVVWKTLEPVLRAGLSE